MGVEGVRVIPGVTLLCVYALFSGVCLFYCRYETEDGQVV